MDLLIWLAALPGIFLIMQVYRMDKIEKEPTGLLLKLIIFGAIIVLPVSFVELLLDSLISELTVGNAAILIENFIGVALVEEFFKYRVLKFFTWKHPAFNYRFDAIVYAVCVSMGFAILENIMYVSEYGLGVAIARMFISVPAHCIFAIFMGINYGAAKSSAAFSKTQSRKYLSRALWVPVLLHGFFDFTASLEADWAFLAFVVFIIVMDIVSIRRIRRASRTDTAIYNISEP